MITEQQLAGLLQRADWTRLSLTARVSRRFSRALRDEQLRLMPRPLPTGTSQVPGQDVVLAGDTGCSLVAGPYRRPRDVLSAGFFDGSGEDEGQKPTAPWPSPPWLPGSSKSRQPVAG